MNLTLELALDEVRYIEAMDVRFTERAKHSVTVSKLLDKWSDFVVEVETGYLLTIDDYTNDLSTRDILQEALDEAPSSLKSKLMSTLKPWDTRFNEATREVDRPLGYGLSKEREPWWFRVPKRLSDELPSDRATWKGIVD